jgi:hypothetical protein
MAGSPPPSEVGPCTAEEAIALTRAAGFGWRQPDGRPGPFRAREFSQGSVIYEDRPPQADPNMPPEAGGCYVIDKFDGHISTWPSYSVEIIAEKYLRHR